MSPNSGKRYVSVGKFWMQLAGSNEQDAKDLRCWFKNTALTRTSSGKTVVQAARRASNCKWPKFSFLDDSTQHKLKAMADARPGGPLLSMDQVEMSFNEVFKSIAQHGK